MIFWVGQGGKILNLTKTERNDWLRILHAWQSPKDFREALDRLEAAQNDHLLTDPRAGFYRDAVCAESFATLVGADLVRSTGHASSNRRGSRPN